MRGVIIILISMFWWGKLFAQITFQNTISKTEKIYGVSKFWNEVNYNFVYFDKVDKKAWESMYKSLLMEVQNTKTDYEYYRLLQKFCATLKDGHTNIWLPKGIRNHILNGEFGDYKFSLKNINGKAIITQINSDKKEEIPVGTEIIEVNGLPTSEYIRAFVKPYIATSTKHILENQSVAELLKAPEETLFKLNLKKPNKEKIFLELLVKKATDTKMYPPKKAKSLLDFKWLKGEIAYVSLNSFGDPKIDSLFIAQLPEIKKAKKLIVDIRNNGGGNTNIGMEILKYLTNDNELQNVQSLSRLHVPTFKAWGLAYNLKAKDTLQGSEENRKLIRQAYLTTKGSYYHRFPYYTTENKIDMSSRVVVPTAILIGNNTGSSAEDFLISSDNQQHMIKIGEPTYGSTGQPMLFNLPGGGVARICTKKDTYPDGREFVGYGVQPDILVKKTYEDYIFDKDPVLERAVEYLNKS